MWNFLNRNLTLNNMYLDIVLSLMSLANQTHITYYEVCKYDKPQDVSSGQLPQR